MGMEIRERGVKSTEMISTLESHIVKYDNVGKERHKK